MFRSCPCLCSPSLNSLQDVPDSLVLRSPPLDPAFHMRLTNAEWRGRLTSAQKAVRLLCHKETLLLYGDLFVHWDPQGLFCWVIFQLVSLQHERGCSSPGAGLATSLSWIPWGSFQPISLSYPGHQERHLVHSCTVLIKYFKENNFSISPFSCYEPQDECQP